MNKLGEVFNDKKAMIVFITCGDPDLETTRKMIEAVISHGADIIILGIPFADPTAEGYMIQQSYLRALKNKLSVDQIIEFVRKLRVEIKIPLIFKTYANIVFNYGIESFLAACKEIDINGLILSDIPYEEKEEFQPLCRKYGIDLISMIVNAPASRIQAIIKDADGFVYTPSTIDAEKIATMVHQNSTLPCVLQSDSIRDIPQTNSFDGIMIDTLIIELLEKYGSASYKQISNLQSMPQYLKKRR